MNIAVIGLGSMGKRRIRLLQEMYPGTEIYGVDNREDRRKEICDLFKIECASSLEQIENTVDCVLVCTAPLSHNAIIHEALLRGCHVFTELNLISEGYQDNIALARKMGKKIFLSSPFFYREEIRYIRERIIGENWNYIYHIGQYLPDWHPWENYKGFFLGDKRTSGCREIMSIELPWLTGTFGDVKEVHALSDKMTELEIDYNDNYMVQLVHENGNKGTLVVDVACPVAVRKLEVYKENRYFSWSGTPESLTEYNPDTKQEETVTLNEKTEHMEGYRAFVIENVYKNEMNAFFDMVLYDKEPPYGMEQDLRTLELIDSMGV